MTSGFLTTHLKSSEAEPYARGVRLAVGFGGAQQAVGVGKEKIEHEILSWTLSMGAGMYVEHI